MCLGFWVFWGVGFVFGFGGGFVEFGGICHFEPFAKRRKIHKNFKIHLKFMDTSLTLSMTRQGAMTRTLRYFTLLRKAQYDKDFVGMTKFISMTNKKRF